MAATNSLAYSQNMRVQPAEGNFEISGCQHHAVHEEKHVEPGEQQQWCSRGHTYLYQTGTPRPMRLRTTDRIAEKTCHIISSILKPYAVLRSTPRPGDFRMHSAKSVPARVNSSAKVFAQRFVRCLCLARYRSGNCCCQMEALHIAKHEYPVQHSTCTARIKRKSIKLFA